MAPPCIVSPGHLINMLSLPSSITLMKGLTNARANIDPCRTTRSPWGLTAALNHLIIVVPTLGFPVYCEHLVGGNAKSLIQHRRSSFFKDLARTIVRLLSVQISKLVTVVLLEGNCCYFAVFPSSFPQNPILSLHGHSSPRCLLSPVSKHGSQELSGQPFVVLNSLASRRQGRQNHPTFLILYFG